MAAGCRPQAPDAIGGSGGGGELAPAGVETPSCASVQVVNPLLDGWDPPLKVLHVAPLVVGSVLIATAGATVPALPHGHQSS